MELQNCFLEDNAKLLEEVIDSILSHPHMNRYFEKSLLFLAISKDAEKCLRFLIKRGVDIHMKSSYGTTALHEAAFYNSIKCLKVLIDLHPDINQTSTFGKDSLLHICVHNRSKDCLVFLLEAGANIHAKNVLGMTPYQLARWNGVDQSFLRLMEKYGA